MNTDDKLRIDSASIELITAAEKERYELRTQLQSLQGIFREVQEQAGEHIPVALKKRIDAALAGTSPDPVAELRAERDDELRAECERLRGAADALVKMYVANRGRREFIACISPKHASEMTATERRNCDVWGAWDAMRAALADSGPDPVTELRAEQEKFALSVVPPELCLTYAGNWKQYIGAAIRKLSFERDELRKQSDCGGHNCGACVPCLRAECERLRGENDRIAQLEDLLTLRGACPPDKGETFVEWLKWAVNEVAFDLRIKHLRGALEQAKTALLSGDGLSNELKARDERIRLLEEAIRACCEVQRVGSHDGRKVVIVPLEDFERMANLIDTSGGGTV